MKWEANSVVIIIIVLPKKVPNDAKFERTI